MVLEADYPTYPAISEAQAIGMKAEAIFRALLPPPRWIVNKVENDFGIDFRVEVASDGKLRGCDFFAQVKGFAGQGDDHPSFRDIRVRCSTARYWREKLLPVLIVAIDVDAARGNFVWFDKALPVPANQDTLSISVPLRKDELLDFKLLVSLAPFWERWVEEVRDEGRIAVYRKLLRDTLIALEALLETYDVLLFAPPGLLDKPEVIDKHREEGVSFCYMILAKWIHDVSLYTSTGLGATQIDDQIRLMIDRSRWALEKVMVPVKEIGGWGVNLMNPSEAVPQLPLFRRIFLDIVDFLACRV